MKILFVFWDMARINLLNEFDNKNTITDIDIFLNKIGGTLYTNCHTPAPDTPRSLACMQTGKYPFDNGCNVRLKYPKSFLNENISSIYDIMSNNSFEQIFYLPERNYNIGPLSSTAYKNGIFYHNKNEFKNSIKEKINNNTNLYAHIHLQDYHWAIDDFGANMKGVEIGQKRVVSFTEDFFKDIDIDNFDYIFIFSDHGHKLRKEVKNENTLELLNKDRTNIIMHIRKKNENSFSKKDKLCSIMDIYPTIGQILDNRIDGISLFSKNEHEEIVFEDHQDFSIRQSDLISRWGIRTKNIFYVTNIYEYIYYENNKAKEISDYEIDLLNKRISLKSPLILEYIKKIKVLKYYKTLTSPNKYYSTGERRLGNKIIKKLIKIILNFTHR